MSWNKKRTKNEYWLQNICSSTVKKIYKINYEKLKVNSKQVNISNDNAVPRNIFNKQNETGCVYVVVKN